MKIPPPIKFLTIILACLLPGLDMAGAQSEPPWGAQEQHAIRCSFVSASIAGDWVERPEYSEMIPRDGVCSYYETNHGSLIYLLNYPEPFGLSDREQKKFLESMKKKVSFWGERSHPNFAQFLANNIFPPPNGYEAPQYFWDIPDNEGNAHLFYMSQLTPRIAFAQVGSTMHIGEEYVPLRMMRADRVSENGGEALILELQTKHPAVDIAIERLKMPGRIGGQRIRYCFVIFGATGLFQKHPFGAVLASPTGSGLDCDGVLNALQRAGPPD